MQQIILWLVQRDPSKRPTALELLTSPLIPSRIHIDEAYVKEIQDCLSGSGPVKNSLLAFLFTPIYDRSDSFSTSVLSSATFPVLRIEGGVGGGEGGGRGGGGGGRGRGGAYTGGGGVSPANTPFTESWLTPYRDHSAFDADSLQRSVALLQPRP